MQTGTARYFVDPEYIVVVDWFAPFAKPSKTKKQPQGSHYSLPITSGQTQQKLRSSKNLGSAVAPVG
jgi:hypothetical protein